MLIFTNEVKILILYSTRKLLKSEETFHALRKNLRKTGQNIIQLTYLVNKYTYMKEVPKILGFLLEFVQVHMIDVERLASFCKYLLFNIASGRLTLALTIVTTRWLIIAKFFLENETIEA